MPRMDGTGPMGMGAMTGRGRGRCAGVGPQGRGGGRGSGRGAGFRGMRILDPGQEKETLALQAEALEAQLAAIKRRLGALDPEAK